MDYVGMTLVLVALIVYFSLRSPNFLSATNFISIANQVPAAIVIAVGMTYVLMIAGIDLSVGSVLGASGAVMGICLDRFGLPLPIAVAACLGTGVGFGLLSGLVTVRWALPSFIVTLGVLEIARGATFLVTDTRTIYLGAKVGILAKASVGGISVMFLLALAIVAAAQFVLVRTVFGRYMIAIGTNEEAVRLSGIKTWPTKAAVFALSGTMAALGGLITTARMESANPNAGTGFELEAIAAVVIGGTSLMGGRGSVVNSFFGVLIMALLSSGLAQVGAEEPTKRVITGCVIVLAVVLDHYRRRLASRRSG
jgi:ribose transport system permease protein